MPDTRRIVGGAVWARADAVSRDARRIYGSELNNTWLRGNVLEVMTQRKNASSKRATTYVKASYMCGNTEKVTILPLQVLKDKDPRAVEAPPLAEFNNENAYPLVLPPPPPEAQPFEENQFQQPPPQPNINPASTNNGRNWYEGVTDVDINGPVPFCSWRMICQHQVQTHRV
jgi:hypothetical protein